jgi:hypothetical protein
MTTADGRPLRVLSLPMPAPLFLDGIRLPASYANFYIGNERSSCRRSTTGTIAPRWTCWPRCSRPARGRHPRGRPGVGLRHAPLHDAAGTRRGDVSAGGFRTRAAARRGDALAPAPSA